MQIETQNVLGSGRTDLLRVADWFFPEGMNHHQLFAGLPGAQRLLQAVARRIAGLGRLPDPSSTSAPSRSVERHKADVLVVGAGPSGMAVALELAQRQRRVVIVDDDLDWGGGARALVPPRARPWQPLSVAFAEAIAQSRIELRLRTTAAGVFGDDVLVAGDRGVEVLVASTLVLAPGAHDGTLAFEGNDVPGVMSARAAGWFLSHGVTVGKRVVVAVADGGGPFGEAYGRAVPSATLVQGTPVRARGSARVHEVTIASRRGERRFPCDTLLVDAPRSPAYEVCAQAGAELAHEPRGFVVIAPGGKIRDGVFAVGEAVGTPFEAEAIAREAVTVLEHM
jgi:sarcosine oxidase subunit alpha